MKRQAAKLILAGAKRCGLTITEGNPGNVLDGGKYGVWNHSGGATEITIAMVNGSSMDTFGAAHASRTVGTYTGVTGTTSGSGTEGTFNIIVGAGGAVTAAVVATPGVGHAVNDTITIADSSLGSGGAPDFTMDFATIGTNAGYRLNHWFKIYFLPTRYLSVAGDIPASGYWEQGAEGIIKDHGNAGGIKNRRPWRNEITLSDSDRKHDMPGYP